MRKLAIVLAAAVLALCLAGCGGSASKASSASASAAASASASSASAAAATVFGDPEVVEVKSGGGETIGTSANFYAAKADCTEENLSAWYADYAKDSKDKWCVIVFTDDASHGVYCNNGMVQVGVGLEKEKDGSYMLADSSGDTVTYVPDSSTGGLKKLDK